MLPILLIYRKYYGMKFTVRITALMLVTMAIAALVVGGLFSLLGAIPSGPRPTRADIFGQVTVNYKLFLNALGIVVFVALFWITSRRGATDPVCGMTVDRSKALTHGSWTARLCTSARRGAGRATRPVAPGASTSRTPTPTDAGGGPARDAVPEALAVAGVAGDEAELPLGLGV